MHCEAGLGSTIGMSSSEKPGALKQLAQYHPTETRIKPFV
jgi:hypothetical protein